MNLSEIVTVDRVAVGLQAASKKKALEETAGLLATAGYETSGSDIFSCLIAREKLGSTGLGHGVAIPHGRMAAVRNSVGAFVRLEQAVDYDAHDGQPVDLMFALVVPQDAGEEHLQHLAAVAELFSDDASCEAIRAATDAESIHKIIAGN